MRRRARQFRPAPKSTNVKIGQIAPRALASYAKQANDEQLLLQCQRIKARATYRCGELLNEIEAGKGGRPKTSMGAHTSLTRKGAAKEAGLSRNQAVTAIRVANIPEDDFERQVESDDVPTVTELARQGMRKRQETDEAEIERRKKVATINVASVVAMLYPRSANPNPERHVEMAFGKAEPKYWPREAAAPLSYATLEACAKVAMALADKWRE